MEVCLRALVRNTAITLVTIIIITTTRGIMVEDTTQIQIPLIEQTRE